MLCLSQVNKRFNPSEPPLLSNLNLTVESATSVAIMGASGCGKSTLARMLVGLLEPSSGDLEFTQDDSQGSSQLGQHIQYVFQ